MGVKTSMLVHSTGDAREILSSQPKLDDGDSVALVRRLFPELSLERFADGDLSDTYPDDDQVYAGCFPGVSVVAASEFALDQPSKLPARYINDQGSGTTVLHAMHSTVDWFAYAIWKDGELVRSLSVSPDDDVVEDIGQPQSFEEPFWAGKHPAVEDDDEYPLPFHPLELGEAALAAFFGYELEGFTGSTLFDPESIALANFSRKARRGPSRSSSRATSTRPWWHFW